MPFSKKTKAKAKKIFTKAITDSNSEAFKILHRALDLYAEKLKIDRERLLHSIEQDKKAPPYTPLASFASLSDVMEKISGGVKVDPQTGAGTELPPTAGTDSVLGSSDLGFDFESREVTDEDEKDGS